MGFDRLAPVAVRRSSTASPSSRAPLQMCEQKEERGRRHAVEPCRLAETRRPVTFELLPDLGGKAGDAVKGKVEWDDDALLLAEGGDVELLALEIDHVARIDGELIGDPDVEIFDLGPDA